MVLQYCVESHQQVEDAKYQIVASKMSVSGCVSPSISTTTAAVSSTPDEGVGGWASASGGAGSLPDPLVTRLTVSSRDLLPCSQSLPEW